MPPPIAHTVSLPDCYAAAAVKDAAGEIRRTLGRSARLAVAFVSPDYLPFLPEFVETLRVDGHILDIIGCTAVGRIAGDCETESGKGCVVLALATDSNEPIEAHRNGLFIQAPGFARPHSALLLANPEEFETDAWLREWNASLPGVPCLGGLASGGEGEELAVFLNDRIVDAVCLPLSGRAALLPILSQGCRPIGEPLTVTRAEDNIVYSLGSQPAYKALESAFESLTDSEKSVAKGNLFAGLAGNEYVEDFKPGDFLIRNIIGADPGSGAVVIGGIPRTGQTLQYQLRNREIARADLARVLAPADLAGTRPFATLLFSCIDRGAGFFGEPHFDAGNFFRAIGGRPLAGFFCNGGIGPVGGRSALHGHAAAAAIWVEKSS